MVRQKCSGIRRSYLASIRFLLNIEACVGDKCSTEECGSYLKKIADKISALGWYLQIYTTI